VEEGVVEEETEEKEDEDSRAEVKEEMLFS
jgi:hypothetical protein